ncbi:MULTISPECIES: hypothetical protein [Streptomyces]|uniref:hypothetical protein n=1 Tax=Streptomyces TaxID=1883 RepID=UPI00224928C3|nr:hypothetical protein [Streptomyces sp. JHD 1]MCX2970248.1 hypothetical protein [Streptomyces sp. JHD 1]
MEIALQNEILDRMARPDALEVAAEATARIRQEIPALRRVRSLDGLVERLVRHLLDALVDPECTGDDVLALARDTGARTAARGQHSGELLAAVRLVAGTIVVRLTEYLDQQDVCVGAGTVGKIAQAVYAAADRVAEAAVTGYVRSRSYASDGPEGRRRRLLSLLLSDSPRRSELEVAARSAGWQLPRRVAVVALRHGAPVEGRLRFPPEALLGLQMERRCLVIPEPDAPGRRHRYETALRGRPAVIGPTVEVTDAATSRRWATRTLELLHGDRAVADGDWPVRAVDMLPRLMTSWSADLVDLAADERLAPLVATRPSLREELEATLLAL